MAPPRLAVNKGDRYNRLVVMRELPGVKQAHGGVRRKFECKCDCGNKVITLLQRLRNGESQSCGCLRKELTTKMATKHGLTAKGVRHPLHSVWVDMKQRCYNKRNAEYKNYGGRGISVCKEWREDFQSFYNWTQTLPEPIAYKRGRQIDRRKNNQDYTPDNCHFVTPVENSRNKRDNVWIDIPKGFTHKLQSLTEHQTTYGSKVFRYRKVRRRFVKQMLLIDLWELCGKKVNYTTARSRILYPDAYRHRYTPLEAVTLTVCN